MITTKKSILALIVFAVGLLTTAYAQTNGDTILGKWTNEDKTRVLEFVKAGTGYDAIIREAPDQDLIGKKQLTRMAYSNGIYTGNVLLPKKGKSYSCTLKMKTDMTMELTAKAGFMSRSQVWARVP
jgi:uncharacterized protein (DUF2147 family)